MRKSRSRRSLLRLPNNRSNHSRRLHSVRSLRPLSLGVPGTSRSDDLSLGRSPSGALVVVVLCLGCCFGGRFLASGG
jgi:hypothetical protein